MLINLRDLKPSDIVTEKDLFASMGDEASTIQTELANYKVLFWLDGWDEVDESYKTSSVFSRLLTGEAFPSATVVISTRPSSTVSLKRYKFTNVFKLKGFTKSQIKAFADDYFSNQSCDQNMSNVFMHELHHTHGLAHLAEVPLNLSIILKVYLEKSKLPNTLTEIYRSILLVTLQHHKEKNNIDITMPIKDSEDLPAEMFKILQGLEKIAYDCFC